VTWTDNYLPGWYLLQGQGNATSPATLVSTVSPNTGTSTSAAVYNYANSTTTSDRALGSLPSNSIASSGSSAYFYGVKIVNTTGQTVNSATISYTGEQYRDGGNTAIQSLTVDYSTNATALTTASGTWTSVPALTFNSPIHTSFATVLDGNASANRVSNINTTISGLSIPNNGSIWIRWTDANDASSDHGLAIDDVNIVLNAMPQSPSISAATENMSGTYTVTVTDANACSATSTTSLTVNPLPTASISGDATICEGGATNLTIQFTGSAPWTYVINGGTPTITNNNPTLVSVSPLTTTTYILTSVSDANCTGTVSGSASITVNKLSSNPSAATQRHLLCVQGLVQP